MPVRLRLVDGVLDLHVLQVPELRVVLLQELVLGLFPCPRLLQARQGMGFEPPWPNSTFVLGQNGCMRAASHSPAHTFLRRT